MRLRIYWTSMGSTLKDANGIVWEEVLARELLPWRKRVRGHIRHTPSGWTLLPAGWFNSETKLYSTQKLAVKAILNNEMWLGSNGDNKRILLLEWWSLLLGLVSLSLKLARSSWGDKPDGSP